MSLQTDQNITFFQPGFCVVDPMCGVGTILIEAAQEHTVRMEIYTELLLACQKTFQLLESFIIVRNPQNI